MDTAQHTEPACGPSVGPESQGLGRRWQGVHTPRVGNMAQRGPLRTCLQAGSPGCVGGAGEGSDGQSLPLSQQLFRGMRGPTPSWLTRPPSLHSGLSARGHCICACEAETINLHQGGPSSPQHPTPHAQACMGFFVYLFKTNICALCTGPAPGWVGVQGAKLGGRAMAAGGGGEGVWPLVGQWVQLLHSCHPAHHLEAAPPWPTPTASLRWGPPCTTAR